MSFITTQTLRDLENLVRVKCGISYFRAAWILAGSGRDPDFTFRAGDTVLRFPIDFVHALHPDFVHLWEFGEQTISGLLMDTLMRIYEEVVGLPEMTEDTKGLSTLAKILKKPDIKSIFNNMRKEALKKLQKNEQSRKKNKRSRPESVMYDQQRPGTSSQAMTGSLRGASARKQPKDFLDQLNNLSTDDAEENREEIDSLTLNLEVSSLEDADEVPDLVDISTPPRPTHRISPNIRVETSGANVSPAPTRPETQVVLAQRARETVTILDPEMEEEEPGVVIAFAGEAENHDKVRFLALDLEEKKRIPSGKIETSMMSETLGSLWGFQQFTSIHFDGETKQLIAVGCSKAVAKARNCQYLPYAWVPKRWTITGNPKMLQSRQKHSAILCTTDNSKFIYVIGGEDVNGESITSVDRVKLMDGCEGFASSWNRVNELGRNLNYCGLAVNDNKIYVVGGIDEAENSYVCRDVKYLEMKSDGTFSWGSATPMPSAVADAAVTVHGTRMYVLGGLMDLVTEISPQNLLQILDIRADTWTAGKPMQRNRSGFSAFVKNGFLYAVGGDSTGSFTAERYNLQAEKWDELWKIPDEGQYRSIAVLDGISMAFIRREIMEKEKKAKEKKAQEKKAQEKKAQEKKEQVKLAKARRRNHGGILD